MIPPSKNMPNRPPNWRWERAKWLNDSGKYVKKSKEDPYVIAAQKFQKRLLKCKSDIYEVYLSEKFPGIYWAHRIYNDEQHVTKYQIEARLLAGDDPERITKRCFLNSPEIVLWYERLFFNISDAMDSLDYLCGVVIGRAIYYGVTDRDYDVLWKLYALASRGQPEILDDLLTPIGNRTAVSFFSDDIKNNISRKAAITSRTMSSSFNQQVILDIHTRLKELEGMAESGEAGSLLNEHIKAMMESFGSSVLRELERSSENIEELGPAKEIRSDYSLSLDNLDKKSD